ncbi:hypothetical protein ACM16X_02375 [Haloarcula japonica]|uniref:hypothetical protein n=1 Tax=Haloarcula japonica TaxID=29282 RepID=UPI0039F6A794
MIGLLSSSSSKPDEKSQEKQEVQEEYEYTEITSEPTSGIKRVVDRKAGVVIYRYASGTGTSISTVPIHETRLEQLDEKTAERDTE